MQTIYQCTWPGCQVRKELCDDIEAHVREQHLRRAAPANREEDDHEEEFYYTEIDIPLQIYQPANKAVCKKLVLSPPEAQDASATSPNAPAAPLLSDHMDMARPPHENPEYGGRPLVATSPTFATIISPGTIQWKAADQGEQAAGQQQQQQPVHAVPIAIPITTFTIATSQQVSCSPTQPALTPSLQSPGKYIRLSPKPYSTSPKSPLRRPRGDQKKCRKVYGMEHRELWCTQCKWKKVQYCSPFHKYVIVSFFSGLHKIRRGAIVRLRTAPAETKQQQQHQASVTSLTTINPLIALTRRNCALAVHCLVRRIFAVKVCLFLIVFQEEI